MIGLPSHLTRRDMLATVGTGIGFLALPSLVQADSSKPAPSTNPLAPRPGQPDRSLDSLHWTCRWVFWLFDS